MRLRTLLKLTLILVALAAWSLTAARLWWWPRIPLRATLAGTADFALVAFSPDGKTLALASSDLSALALWDVDNASERVRIPWKGSSVSETFFSPDGRLLAAQDGAGLVLWDVTTGQLRTRVTEPVEEVAFSPDSKLLAGKVEGDDWRSGRVKVWDATSGKALTDFHPFYAFRFCPGGGWLAVQADRDTPVRLWNLVSKREEVRLKGFLDSTAFSPGGDLIALADSSCIRMYSLPSGGEVALIKSPDSRDLAFSADGKALAFCNNPGRSITLWDLNASRELATIDEGHIYGRVSFSLNGSLLAVQSEIVNADSALWDVGRNPARLLSIGGSQSGLSVPTSKSEQSVAFTADGKTLITRELSRPQSESLGPLDRYWLIVKYRFSSKHRLWPLPKNDLRLVEVASRRPYAMLEKCDFWLLTPDGMTLATQSYDEKADDPNADDDAEPKPLPTENIKLWTVPRRPPLVLRLLYTLGPPILLFTALWFKKLAFRRRARLAAVRSGEITPCL